jgi:salicylate hydroxylase
MLWPLTLIPSFPQHSDLRRLLYDAAISCGAKVRMNATVVSMDPRRRTVTLRSGEILQADVIVGADGSAGLTRREIDVTVEAPKPGKLKMFRYLTVPSSDSLVPAYRCVCSATVPRDLILNDPEISYIYEQKNVSENIINDACADERVTFRQCSIGLGMDTPF